MRKLTVFANYRAEIAQPVETNLTLEEIATRATALAAKVGPAGAKIVSCRWEITDETDKVLASGMEYPKE